jgi:hypothetical protein
MKVIQQNCSIGSQQFAENNYSGVAIGDLVQSLLLQLKSDLTIPSPLRESATSELEASIRRGDIKVGRWDTIKLVAKRVAEFSPFAELAKAILENLS